MIWLNKQLGLQKIQTSDAARLLDLMQVVYLPVYQHLWVDKGVWYLNNIFGAENLKEELKEPKSPYYFVVFKKETIGILRLQEELRSKEQQNVRVSKLHRLYLDPKIHNKGIGKSLLNFCEEKVREAGSKQLWLEVMDSQEQAIEFYKKNGFEITGTLELEYQRMFSHFRGMYKMVKSI